MGNEEFQKAVLEKFNEIQKDMKDLKTDLKDLKIGQNELLDMLRNLESTNGDRHIKLSGQIEEIKQDLNTIEKVTAKNWKDIANIKDFKKAK